MHNPKKSRTFARYFCEYIKYYTNMAKKNFKKEDEQLENVNEALSTTGQWIEDNSNLLTWCVTAIVVVILGIIAINNYVIKPKAVEASNENAKAVVYFQNGDFEKALNGDEAECIGFEEIANSYKLYRPGKLAALYAGICYFQLGDMDNAAKYLKRFNAKDVNVGPAAHQLLGDAYVEMEEYSKADARAFLADKFDQQGDFGILPRDVFEKMLDKVMELDEAFMAESGVNDGAVYDDDQAFEYMMEKLQAAFPEQKMYVMRFVEDYMEYDEAYLESVGLIDWE